MTSMTTAETITLVGIIITFLVAFVGLILNLRVSRQQIRAEKELAELRSKFDAEMEIVRQLGPGRLQDIDYIKQWVQDGVDLYREAGYIQEYLAGKFTQIESKSDPYTLVVRASNWTDKVSRIAIYAERYDTPSPETSSERPFFSWPLPNLLFTFEMEVITFINQQLKVFFERTGGSHGAPGQVVIPPSFDWPSDAPKYPDKFSELCKATIAAIERAKEGVVSQTTKAN